jgi:hypothetical protein
MVDPGVGMIIGFLSEGAAAIGCIVRIQDVLEEGTGVGAMWVVTGHLLKRGERRVVVGATRVVFSGGGESHERVIGEWRALDANAPRSPILLQSFATLPGIAQKLLMTPLLSTYHLNVSPS